MNIQSIDLLGNSSIGIFSLSTAEYAIFPYNLNEDLLAILEETLQTPVIQTTLNNSNLNGLFAVGNSNHLLLPHLVGRDELSTIKENLPDDTEINILDSKITALGNVISATDSHAVVSPEFTGEEKRQIADALDVEVESREILGSTIVGSMIFLTERGLLAHPLTSEEDLDWLEYFFKIPVDVVTVNRGTPYPRPGIVGNGNGILVGSDTTGPELMRIFEVLLG